MLGVTVTSVAISPEPSIVDDLHEAASVSSALDDSARAVLEHMLTAAEDTRGEYVKEDPGSIAKETDTEVFSSKRPAHPTVVADYFTKGGDDETVVLDGERHPKPPRHSFARERLPRHPSRGSERAYATWGAGAGAMPGLDPPAKRFRRSSNFERLFRQRKKRARARHAISYALGPAALRDD